MTPAARYAAAIDILDTWLSGTPVEKALTGWARRSRYAGSKDRAAIRDIVFDCVRCKRSFSARGGASTGRGLVLGSLAAQGIDPDNIFTGDGYAPSALLPPEKQAFEQLLQMDTATTLDLPDWLEPQLRTALGPELEPIMDLMRQRAPLFLRTNLSRISREALIARLASDQIAAAPSSLCVAAIEVTENGRKLRQTNSILDGLAEPQDAASQAICYDFPITGSERILDFCAGGGGKALALADRLKQTGSGQVSAHDIDPARMGDIPERARRAKLDIEILSTESTMQAAPFDIVFCDAPCSGSGAWRRAPEGKWILTEDRLDQLLQIQAEILDKAVPLVASGGLLIYATCSLLNSENEAQIEAFLDRHNDWKCLKTNRFSPLQGGDGFFSAHLTRDV